LKIAPKQKLKVENEILPVFFFSERMLIDDDGMVIGERKPTPKRQTTPIWSQYGLLFIGNCQFPDISWLNISNKKALTS
jgi:hypothetical protein